MDNKSLRISLTETCNYKCFFCHEEGLNMQKKRNSKRKEEVYDVIKIGLKNGYNDITFTGGEPLIKKNDILWYFEKLKNENEYPDITIVTNGLLITDELLECVASYKGNFKFNISLHSLNAEDYEKIICVKNNKTIKGEEERFIKIKENIKKAKERNLEIKLNFVLLKGINTGKEKIQEILDFGIENNIDYIKFLELLVIEGKESLYKYFTEIEQIEEEWKDNLEFISNKIPRRKLYLYKNKLKIEFQKCTCSFGCSECLKNRDVNITSEMKYFPCFILSEDSYTINENNFLNSVKLGNQKILEFSEKYKDDSPLLIKKRKYIEEKIEFYYKSELKNKKEIEDILKLNNYKIYRTLETSERYYISNNKFEIRKLFKHSHNDLKYTEIIQTYFIDKNGGINVRYLNRGEYNKPEEVHDLAEYEKKLKEITDYDLKKLEWEINMYKNENDEIVSVGKEKNSDKILIMSPDEEIKNKEILDGLKLKKIKKLPLNYILKLNNIGKESDE